MSKEPDFFKDLLEKIDEYERKNEEEKQQFHDEKIKLFTDNFLDNSKLIIFLLLILFLLVIYVIYFLNPFNIKNNKFSIIGILILLFFEMQILFLIKKRTDETYIKNYKSIVWTSTFIISLFLIAIYLIFFVSIHFFSKNLFSNIILISLQALLIIVLLAIFHFSSENGIIHSAVAREIEKKTKESNSFSFLKKLIFFVPCLFLDFIKYLSSLFGGTPLLGYILLLLTILLIFAIIKFPILINFLQKNKNLLLRGPVYLNNKHELGVFQEFTVNNKPKLNKFNKNLKLDGYELDIDFEKYNKTIPFSYNYEIICEIYINPQPSNTSYAYNKYSNLLNYGNKPSIEYLGKENKLKISCQTNDNKSENLYESIIGNESQFKLQRWNKIKIKVDGGNVDIFINNHLVGSKQKIIPHMNHDKIILGEKDGINGGIKNFYFYNNSKDVQKIDNSDFDI